jgi:hypothetical protein
MDKLLAAVRLGSQAWRCERQSVCCLAYRQERREARARREHLTEAKSPSMLFSDAA